MVDKQFLINNEWKFNLNHRHLGYQPILIRFSRNGEIISTKLEKAKWNLSGNTINIQINNSLKFEFVLNKNERVFLGLGFKSDEKWNTKLTRLEKTIDKFYLINNNWQLISNKPDEVIDINFLENNILKYKELDSNWHLKDDNLTIYVNNFAYYLASVSYLNIKGKAINKNKFCWEFEIKRKNEFDEEPFLSYFQFLNTTWEVIGYENHKLTFLENKLVSFSKDEIQLDNGSWHIVGDILTIKFPNDSIFNFTLDVDILKSKPQLNVEEEIHLSLKEIFQLLKINEKYEKYNFGIQGEVSNSYKWFAIWRYYPKSKFAKSQLTNENLLIRKWIYNFKEGKEPFRSSQIIANSLLNQFDKTSLRNKTLIIIPASNEIRTIDRFEEICKMICEYTGMKNGFNIISNNHLKREPISISNNRNLNLSEFVKLNKSVKDQDFIVLDDIRTTGRSSNNIFNLLKNNGANEVIFIYLGKTVENNN